uniref:Variant surface glycoprotein 1125.131 n=1 Tax=Trypanosoma brucei TaxID=5691 RepID=A0A1J0R588_9TRYP|nr:variant surface glycoprotein 1125.131 [Trypanosoma brucei]
MFHFIALLVIFAAAVCKQSSGTAGDGANAAAFTTLCTIDQLASANLPEQYKKPADVTESLKRIRQIVAATTNQENITAVPHNIPGTIDEAATAACKSKSEQRGACEDLWKKWHQVKKDAQAVKSTTKFKDLTAAERKHPLTAITAEQLALIEVEATRLTDQLTDFNKLANHQKLKAARSALNQARFGKDVEVFAGVDPNTAPMGTSRGAGCAQPNAGSSIAHDMMCLCATDNSAAGITKPCGFAAACGSGNWQACTAQQQQAAYTAIAAACKNTKAPATTATTLSTVIHTFLSALAVNAAGDASSQAVILLGQQNANSCGGGSGKTCVDYTKYVADDSSLTDIPWLKQLSTAAKELKEFEQQLAVAEQTANKVNSLANKAERLYATAKAQAQLPNSLAPLSTQTVPPKTSSATRSCKSPAQTAQDCPSPDCIYNETTKECKPKAGSENTAEGTEGTATGATTTTGCARHGNDKAACENDKTGDKQNCAWRKDKNNEDEKDTEKCRDSSFLVNKKLDLSMGATFMSLLFS